MLQPVRAHCLVPRRCASAFAATILHHPDCWQARTATSPPEDRRAASMQRGSNTRHGRGMYLETTTGRGLLLPAAWPPSPRMQSARNRSDAPQWKGAPSAAGRVAERHDAVRQAGQTKATQVAETANTLSQQAVQSIMFALCDTCHSRLAQPPLALTALSRVEQVAASLECSLICLLHGRRGERPVVSAVPIPPGLQARRVPESVTGRRDRPQVCERWEYYPLQLGPWFANAKCGGGQSQTGPRQAGRDRNKQRCSQQASVSDGCSAG